MCLTELELQRLLATDTELWQTAIKRGKGFQRSESRAERTKEKRLSEYPVTAAVVFCFHCGSSLVDVNGWADKEKAIFYCSNCGHHTSVEGFTLGRVLNMNNANFTEAIQDVAVYQRNAEIKQRIQEANNNREREQHRSLP